MSRWLITLAVIAGLVGCNHNLADHGYSYDNNQAVQTMYDEPVAAEDAPAFDGPKADAVLEEYRRADTRAEDRRLLRELGN